MIANACCLLCDYSYSRCTALYCTMHILWSMPTHIDHLLLLYKTQQNTKCRYTCSTNIKVRVSFPTITAVPPVYMPRDNRVASPVLQLYCTPVLSVPNSLSNPTNIPSGFFAFPGPLNATVVATAAAYARCVGNS